MNEEMKKHKGLYILLAILVAVLFIIKAVQNKKA
jgi:uncharacterized integral membrane protein